MGGFKDLSYPNCPLKYDNNLLFKQVLGTFSKIVQDRQTLLTCMFDRSRGEFVQCWQACVRVYDAVWRGAVAGDTPLYTSSQPAANWGKGEESDKTTNSVLKAGQHTEAVPLFHVCAGCWYSARPPLGRHYLGGGPAAD